MNTNKVETLDYLNRQLIEAIEFAKATGTNAVSFVKEQAPDVVNQLIKWEMTKTLTYSCLFFLGVIPSVYFLVKGIKILKKNHSDEGFCCVLFSLIALSFMSFNSVSWFLDFLKVYIAPKIWLLEYAAKLLK